MDCCWRVSFCEIVEFVGSAGSSSADRMVMVGREKDLQS